MTKTRFSIDLRAVPLQQGSAQLFRLRHRTAMSTAFEAHSGARFATIANLRGFNKDNGFRIRQISSESRISK